MPTIAETVPGYAVESWYGLYAPTGTPVDVVAKLNAAAKRRRSPMSFATKLNKKA